MSALEAAAGRAGSRLQPSWFHGRLDGGATYAVDQWLDSPGHRAKILRSSYTRIGVAQLYDASTKRYYAVQVFGS